MSNQELTKRQLEIVRMVATGKMTKEIAYDLGVSTQTVKNHLTTIYLKTGMSNRTALAMLAVREGWLR